MTGTALADLSSEIDVSIRDCSPARRARMLAQIAACFLSHSDRLSLEQLGVFDDVMLRLASRVDLGALSELSTVLADVIPVPHKTIRRLAYHENPAVAGPVLMRSTALSDADLIEITNNRGQQHLIAISKRAQLGEAVTEAILRHAGKDAKRLLAKNPGARFNGQGYACLLAATERDEVIAESLGLRPDVPADALQSLLARTTEAVRARLLKGSPPAARERVRAALDAVPISAGAKTPAQNHAEAHAAVVALNKTGKLNDSTVNRFAIRREYPNVIAALVLLSGATIDIIAPLMDEESGGGLIIACRASRLNWQTTLAVLNNRRVAPLSKEQLDQAREVFEMLLVSSAQYTIRFEPPSLPGDKSASNGQVAAAAGRR
ncbi:MAG TPA: DUF2336 domain-containing protein [Bradyrhizobium sp.]|uniref:DUF2336 domain-containing protein n=1 Tax=Bradyrhizobium sp. TaxID=376 RepID=UPI002C135235|nr:DUF2336 domain-containing protein [Bradyrhizobium sp.]HLZ00797.1 DUF2336 domain-containing protein [Bradyrhizobium sp.]